MSRIFFAGHDRGAGQLPTLGFPRPAYGADTAPPFLFLTGAHPHNLNPGTMSRQIYLEANILCSAGPGRRALPCRLPGLSIRTVWPLNLVGIVLTTVSIYVIPAVLFPDKAPKLKKQTGVERKQADALLITGGGVRPITSRPFFSFYTVRRYIASLYHLSTPGRFRAGGCRVQSPRHTVGPGPIFHTGGCGGNTFRILQSAEVASLGYCPASAF